MPAVCDVTEANLARAQALVEKTGRPRPEGYSAGVEDFRRLVLREDPNAVIISSPSSSCAVKRRWFTVGESPTRELVRSTR